MSNFKAMKFRVCDAEQSKDLQEVLFKLGYGWGTLDTKTVLHTNREYVFANADGSMKYCTLQVFFINETHKEQDTEQFIAQHKRDNKGANMNKPHKHAELIKAWADGAENEYRNPSVSDYWYDEESPNWNEYRIKIAEPVEMWKWAYEDYYSNHFVTSHLTEQQIHNLADDEGYHWFVRLEKTKIVKEQ